MIIFANSLDPDLGLQNVGPDLDPKADWKSDGIPDRIFEKSYFEKKKKYQQ